MLSGYGTLQTILERSSWSTVQNEVRAQNKWMITDKRLLSSSSLQHWFRRLLFELHVRV